MHLNAAGRIVQSVWDEIPTFYAGIKIDEFIVMPDHVHGIIQIVGAAPVAARCMKIMMIRCMKIMMIGCVKIMMIGHIKIMIIRRIKIIPNRFIICCHMIAGGHRGPPLRVYHYRMWYIGSNH